MPKLSFIKLERNMVLSLVAIVAVIIVGAVIAVNQGFSFFGPSDSQIGKKIVDYINNNGLSTTPASLVSISNESGLVKAKIKIGSNEFDSYATRDGKLLFPQAFNMDQKEGDKTADSSDSGDTEKTKQTCDTLKKVDNTQVEAFIVSRCPFGLQMQRVIAEMLKTAPDLAANIKVRYMGSISDGKVTSMHGDAEAQENLKQICIREEQPAKYWPYVSCQMKKTGTEAACLKTAGVDTTKLNACVSDAKKGLAYAKVDFDLTDKYKVTGSPTLILNGQDVSEFDFGGRTPEALKSVICCSSNKQASVCSKTLDKTSAATSFSENYAAASGSTSASCGN